MKEPLLEFIVEQQFAHCKILISTRKLHSYKDWGGPLPHGVEFGKFIILNPNRGKGIWGFLDTVIHESIHKLDQNMSESKVRTETTRIKKLLTLKQRQHIFRAVAKKARWIR